MRSHKGYILLCQRSFMCKKKFSGSRVTWPLQHRRSAEESSEGCLEATRAAFCCSGGSQHVRKVKAKPGRDKIRGRGDFAKGGGAPCTSRKTITAKTKPFFFFLIFVFLIFEWSFKLRSSLHQFLAVRKKAGASLEPRQWGCAARGAHRHGQEATRPHEEQRGPHRQDSSRFVTSSITSVSFLTGSGSKLLETEHPAHNGASETPARLDCSLTASVCDDRGHVETFRSISYTFDFCIKILFF